MDKQAQDNLWNDLPEKYKSCYSVEYKRAKHLLKDDPNNFTAQEVIRAIEPLFGSHNLNPKQIKTWEDVEKENEVIKNIFKNLEFHIHRDLPYKEHDLIKRKILATYQIQQLIELGYGGIVSEEEWKKSSSYEKEDAIWSIECEYKKNYDGPQFRIACGWEQVCFPAFHSKELAEEFMSHESNRQLVQQYFIM
ncbi:MAG: hypothetical protein J1E16_04295 [Muribaculaceae bacterium]|nr:hypothetical protein [Muribaculaceae bacterium]